METPEIAKKVLMYWTWNPALIIGVLVEKVVINLFVMAHTKEALLCPKK